MTREDWENVARCARERRLQYPDDRMRRLGEWHTWMMAQTLSGRCPF